VGLRCIAAIGATIRVEIDIEVTLAARDTTAWPFARAALGQPSSTTQHDSAAQQHVWRSRHGTEDR
jgi:hypothetical protein